jgi:PAS domain S-box-containing protein
MGIYIIDADLNTLYANQALLDMFGYENIEEIRTKPLDEHYTAESRVGLAQRRERYLRGEPNPERFELDIVRNGTIRHLQAYLKDILWNGKTQRQVIYHDITELRNAEEALKESEQYFRNFLDKSVMGVRVRQDGYIVYANQALLDIFGCENIDELRASPPEERYTPECRADFLQRKTKLANGEPLPAEIEVNIARKDGTIRHLQVFGRQFILNGKTQTQTFYNDITEHKVGEMKILESERQYRLLAENMTDVIWKVNIDSPSHLNYISPSVTHLLGYTVEEAMNKNMAEIFTPRSFNNTMKALAEQRAHVNQEPIDQSNSRTMELELKHKEGSIVFVEVNYTLIRGVDGRPIEILAVARDITERRRTEEQLRQSETKYSTLVEKGNDGVVIIQDGLISFANSKMTNITGTPPEESIGQSFVDFVAPKYRKFVADNYIKRIRGEKCPGSYEIEIITKEGTFTPAEICANAIEYRGKAADMAVIRDITERKRAEETLKASEEKYSALVEQSSDGIVIVDGSLIEFGNKMICAISGYCKEELIGKNFLELISLESKELLLERERRRLAGKPILDNYELEIIAKDKRKVPVETKLQRIAYKGKSVIMVIIRDITESKESEKLLRESEHNLRTYLDNAPDGIYLNDLNGHFLYGNKKAEEILGYKKEELIGSNFLKLNLLPGKYLGKAGKLLALNAMGINTGPDEFELIKKDKTRIWVEINTAPLKRNDKKVVIGFVRDITERKQIGTKLQSSEQNFRNSLDSSSIGIRISDKEDQTTYINQAMLDIFGYESIGEVRTSPPWKQYTPESYTSYVLRHEKLLRGEQMPDHVEIDVIRKDSTIRHLDVSMRGIFWDGKRQFQTLYNDITERKQTEEALHESEEKYRLIVEKSQDILFTFNVAGEFLYLSPSVKNVLGYNPDALIGRNFGSLVHAEDLPGLQKVIQMNIKQGYQTPGGNRYRVRHASGEWRWHNVAGNAVFDTNGKFLSFVAVSRDVTEHKKAEEALHESEEKYRLIVENSRDMIFTIDANEQYVYVSPSVTNMLGYNPAELIGKQFLSLVHPEDRHFIEEETRLSYLPGYKTTGDNEYRIRHVSGEWRWVLTRGTRVIDNNGNFVHFTGIARDVTEQKQTAEKNRHLSSIVESSDDAIIGKNLAGTIISWNKGAERIYGFAESEAIGKPIFILVPDSHCDEVTEFLNQIRLGKHITHYETVRRRKDGDLISVSLTISPIYDNTGKIVGASTIARDITAQKQAQKRIEQASQEWRTTFDSITDLISIHDKNNRIVRVNKTVADLLKTTPQELIGKFCHEVMRGDQECPANCPHLLALKTGKPSSIEIFNSRLGLHLQESASPLFNEKGEITGTVLVARDVTQEKRMEEQLVMTDRLASIGELSSGIAHELNNPLTSVIGFSQLLMEGDVPDDIKEDLGIVHSEAQRAAAIVKNLLTFARKHAPVKELNNINSVIEDVLRLRSYEQKVNNIEVENRLSPNLPEIMIDHFQMQQVFLNIMVNAEFAMMEAHHKGKMVITTEKLDGIIRISFADDGPGISKENLKHIFDPFFTTKEVGKGTGLGLSICHGIVTEHCGKIYAVSEKGRGATFIVELPSISEQ